MRSNGPGLVRAIVCDVILTTPTSPDEAPQNNAPTITVKGLWDTGATGSVINKRVADALGIKPIGKTLVHHADGSTERDVYLVNIILPSNVGFPGVRVTEGTIAGVDMLIGMDVINAGDFSITNHNGSTVATFRVPSCHEIDYVKIINSEVKQRQLDKYLPRPKKKHGMRR